VFLLLNFVGQMSNSETATDDGVQMSKLDIFIKLMESPEPDFIREVIHEDFFLLREEGLETYDEFVDYILGHQEAGHEHEIKMLEVRCLFEDENSLVVQDLFESLSQGKRFTTITYFTMKDGKFWRAMMNKFEVDANTIRLK
jgi:hypothetical protein